MYDDFIIPSFMLTIIIHIPIYDTKIHALVSHKNLY